MVYRVTRSFEIVKFSQVANVGLPYAAHGVNKPQLTVVNRSMMYSGLSSWRFRMSR